MSKISIQTGIYSKYVLKHIDTYYYEKILLITKEIIIFNEKYHKYNFLITLRKNEYITLDIRYKDFMHQHVFDTCMLFQLINAEHAIKLTVTQMLDSIIYEVERKDENK